MIAMDGLQVIIFIICPAILVLWFALLVWVEKSDSPWAEKQRRLNAERQRYDAEGEQTWDPEESYGGLKYEMREYYRRENSRRDG